MKARSLIMLAGLFLLPVSSLSCQKLDESHLSATPGFQMRDNLMGTIVQSSDRNDVGKKVSFIGLESEKPKILLENGLTSPMQKVFESDGALTLLLVASGTGSVDTFVIDKKTGEFSRASAGSFAGVYASAALGTLK